MLDDDDEAFVEGEEIELTDDVIVLQERIDEINTEPDDLERKRMARTLFEEMYHNG